MIVHFYIFHTKRSKNISIFHHFSIIKLLNMSFYNLCAIKALFHVGLHKIGENAIVFHNLIT